MSEEPGLGKIYDAILDIKGDVGALKSAAANSHEFIKAVSAKIDRHTSDGSAHWKSIIALGGALSALLEWTKKHL